MIVLNLRAETGRLLDGNIGINVYDPALGSIFLAMKKSKTDKWDLTKIRNVCAL